MSRNPEALWAVILAGGIGSRFWPVSTPERPKQLLPLASEQPLITDTVERIAPLVPRERLRLLANEQLGHALLSATPGLDASQLWAEPEAKGTAPVLIWAAHTIAQQDPDAVMVSLHADHAITPAEAFRETLLEAASLAQSHQHLFTLGIEPTRPETGYGYLHVGEALSGRGRRVQRFVEKPSREVAERYVKSGEYLWNSGIFIWRVRDLLAEVRAHAPELAAALPLLDRGDVKGFFAQAPSISIDEAIMERSQRVSMLPATFEWDDVGAWDAVARTRQPDDQGNVSVGEAHMVDASGCITWTDQGAVIAFGVEDLVIVREGEVTLVAHKSRAAEMKMLLQQLPPKEA